MKIFKYLLLVSITFFLFLPSFNTVNAKQLNYNPQDIDNIVKDYMNRQYSSLQDSKVSSFDDIVADKYLLDILKETIQYKIDFYSEINKKVLGYKLSISNIETKFENGRIVAHILSSAELTFQKDELEPYTYLEEREHIIILENVKDTWKITRDIYDEFGTPDESAINDSNYNKNLYNTFKKNKISVKEKAKLLKKLQDSISQSSLDETQNKTNLASTQMFYSTAIESTSLDKGVEYARKWALSYNPAYQKYDNDCTNFVSQILYAAGFKTDSTWKPYTNAWIQVEAFHDYLVNKKGFRSYEYSSGDEAGNASNKASVGDVIQFYNIAKLRYSHTVYATKKVWRSARGTYDILYCGHSSARLDYSLIDAFESSSYYTRLRVIKIYYGPLIA
ncbi:amidase domain-containing protein [Heyndrickxia faecalis]|uniref:amidase domain-containing protein n=1 Tax=Bacillales TaxID=1385 RepID=UPI003D2348E6